jgi:hypothetical protein
MDATYTQNNTNTEETSIDIHALSGIRTHERAKAVHGLDCAATVYICTHIYTSIGSRGSSVDIETGNLLED